MYVYLGGVFPIVGSAQRVISSLHKTPAGWFHPNGGFILKPWYKLYGYGGCKAKPHPPQKKHSRINKIKVTSTKPSNFKVPSGISDHIAIAGMTSPFFNDGYIYIDSIRGPHFPASYVRLPKCTLPETNSSPLKISHPKRKGSYSNHPFSGAMLQGVYLKFLVIVGRCRDIQATSRRAASRAPRSTSTMPYYLHRREFLEKKKILTFHEILVV